MSQQPPEPTPIIVQPESNTLGVAGFVVALAGIVLVPFTGGTGVLLSPIGALLSLIALGKRPRGFAVAGLIIGLLGSCGALVVLFLVLVVGVAILGIAVMALTSTQQFEVSKDMAIITFHAQQYEEENGVLPANLQLLSIDQTARVDPWGNEYRYILDDTTDLGFDIISDGKDGEAANDDDIYLSKLGEYWEEAVSEFQGKMDRLERGEPIEDPAEVSEESADESGDDAQDPPTIP